MLQSFLCYLLPAGVQLASSYQAWRPSTSRTFQCRNQCKKAKQPLVHNTSIRAGIALAANLISAREGSPEESVSFLDDVMSRAKARVPNLDNPFTSFQTTAAQTAGPFGALLPT